MSQPASFPEPAFGPPFAPAPEPAFAPAPAPAYAPAPASAPTPAPALPAGPPTFTERWLHPSAAPSWRAELQRLLLATAGAAGFGVSLGLRKGGTAILVGALGAPAGILAVAAVAVPAFAIVLALANAPLDMMDLARATSRAATRAGLLLAGIAPGIALLVVSCEETVSVSIFGFGALLLAGGIAANAFAKELRPHLRSAPGHARVVLAVALPVFLLFAATLAGRVWWLALPMLTEVS
jgi:hypothetical protein